MCFVEIHHIVRGALYRDTLNAWMIGRFAAEAFHQPAKYPRMPELDGFGGCDSSVKQEIERIRRKVILQQAEKRWGQNGR